MQKTKEEMEELIRLSGHDPNSIADASDVKKLTDEEIGFDEQPFH